MSNDNDKCQEYQKNMGKRLRKIRKENALSQDDVADALGICTCLLYTSPSPRDTR